jgi:hypothetical protein
LRNKRIAYNTYCFLSNPVLQKICHLVLSTLFTFFSCTDRTIPPDKLSVVHLLTELLCYEI